MFYYIEGAARAWSFRWIGACRPGLYLVTVSVSSFFAENFDAVVDDFGNLVRVQ